MPKGAEINDGEEFIVVGDLGLVSTSDGVVAVQLGADAAEADLDARVLTVASTPEGVRRRPFGNSLRELSEADWLGWPIRGPRITR